MTLPHHLDVEAMARLRQDVADAVRLLCRLDEGGMTELRILGVPENRWQSDWSGYFRSAEKLAEEAVLFSYQHRARGVYVVLNEIDPALYARCPDVLQRTDRRTELTSDKNIIRRRWLPIDIDPVRPAGISSSDEEHELALERCRDIAAWLRERFPAPVALDSGNGGHLLYSIDLPAEDDSAVQRQLEALDARFSDARVKVDTANYNPSRIWKLPGTVARKGADVPERPHRIARILSCG